MCFETQEKKNWSQLFSLFFFFFLNFTSACAIRPDTYPAAIHPTVRHQRHEPTRRSGEKKKSREIPQRLSDAMVEVKAVQTEREAWGVLVT